MEALAKEEIKGNIGVRATKYFGGQTLVCPTRGVELNKRFLFPENKFWKSLYKPKIRLNTSLFLML